MRIRPPKVFVSSAINNHLWGGSQSERIYGGDGDDLIYGDHSKFDDAKKDYLNGGNGSDTLLGGSGDDGISNQWDRSSIDQIDGGPGQDTLSVNFSHLRTGIDIDYIKLAIRSKGSPIFANIERFGSFVGGNGSDTVQGDRHDNTVYGGSGDDLVFAGAGLDRVYGGDGADEIDGGNGRDYLAGGGGPNTIKGGSGDDGIVGGEVRDYLSGGSGIDKIGGQAQRDIIFGGNDTDSLDGGAGDDKIGGDAGDDVVFGGEGSDEITGDAGADGIMGGPGRDTAFGGADGDTIFGGEDDDALRGEKGDDSLVGENGKDLLDGGADADFLFGGEDSDLLLGGSGDDTIDGEAGRDQVDSGSGNDVILSENTEQILAGEGDDRVAATGGRLILGSGDDTVLFNFDSLSRLYVEGGEGHDRIDMDLSEILNPLTISLDGTGKFSAKTPEDSIAKGLETEDLGLLLLGSGNDLIQIEQTGDLIVVGGTGTDTVTSGAGDDVISGAEFVQGGAGNDRIQFSSATVELGSLQAIFDTAQASVTEVAERLNGVFGSLQSLWTSLSSVPATDTWNAIPSASIEVLDTYTGGGFASGASMDFGGAWNNASAGGTSTGGILTAGGYTLNGGFTWQNTGGTVIPPYSGGITQSPGLAWLPGFQGTPLPYTPYETSAPFFSSTLDGGIGYDTIIGSSGSDSIFGGIGADAMDGLGQSDYYYVDNPGDVVSESSTEASRDLVFSSIRAFTLSPNLEDLSLVENGRDGTGNEGNNRLKGTSLANNLAGEAGADTLYGNGGIDTLIGGEDSDYFFVSDEKTKVVENEEGGELDTVHSSVNFTLPDQVEGLRLSGSASVGSGNDLNNIIEAGYVSSRLVGGAGNDSLSGSSGSDTLIGVDVNSAGAGEIDRLVGNGGLNLFVLGDEKSPYYNASPNEAVAGEYAVIAGFVDGADHIQLSGASEDYSVNGSLSIMNGAYTSVVTGLYRGSEGSESRDLIAVFHGSHVELLNSAIFV